MLVPASPFRNDQNFKKTENSDVKGCAGKKSLTGQNLTKNIKTAQKKNQDDMKFEYK